MFRQSQESTNDQLPEATTETTTITTTSAKLPQNNQHRPVIFHYDRPYAQPVRFHYEAGYIPPLLAPEAKPVIFHLDPEDAPRMRR